MREHRRAGVAGVEDAVVSLLRLVRRGKAKVQAAGDDMHSATRELLRIISSDGPMRASALATIAQTDSSTVSRQVALMIEHGLLERRADQCDGRASLLALTDSGEALIAEFERDRHRFFDRVMDGWTAEEMAVFSELLERFTTSYEKAHDGWLDERRLQSNNTSTRSRVSEAGRTS